VNDGGFLVNHKFTKFCLSEVKEGEDLCKKSVLEPEPETSMEGQPVKLITLFNCMSCHLHMTYRRTFFPLQLTNIKN
jgi:hypothetical protein